MTDDRMLYEGKAKKLYATDDPGLLRQYFKDDATAFNAQKRGIIVGKGCYNARISAVLFKLLEQAGVPTHFVREVGERDLLVRRLDMIPVETIVRNVVAGSLARRLGRTPGEELPQPVVEFYYKNDALGDPMINEWHMLAFGLATRPEIDRMVSLGLRTNEVLREFFDRRGIILVDMKLEFGRAGGEVVLGDEICPDTCRFWDKATREVLDKDRFRRDMGQVEEAYAEICRRVESQERCRPEST